MATDGFRYDPYGAGTEYEMAVPAWALKPCPECDAQHNIEGHAEGCLKNEIFCSSCGAGFHIPGRAYGFSHCDDHAGYQIG
jgi:hypothetical protein